MTPTAETKRKLVVTADDAGVTHGVNEGVERLIPATEQKRKLVVTADDAGVTHGVNEGVERLIKAGRLRNVSLMVNMPSAGHAADMLRKYPQVSVGLHFNIYQGKPLSSAHPGLPALLNAQGEFLHSLPGLVRALNFRAKAMEAARCELQAQLAAFRALGLEPTHIDIHKFLAFTPVWGYTEQVAEEESIPFVRWPAEPESLQKILRAPMINRFRPWASSRLVSWATRRTPRRRRETVRVMPCAGMFCIGEWTMRTIEKILSTGTEEAIEIVSHPGCSSPALAQSGTRLIKQREHEMEILLSGRFGEMLDKYGWSIAGFRDCLECNTQ